jgi:hypothetical protein
MGIIQNTAPPTNPYNAAWSEVEVAGRIDGVPINWVKNKDIEVKSINRVVNGIDTAVIAIKGGVVKHVRDPAGQAPTFRAIPKLAQKFVRIKIFNTGAGETIVWYGYVLSQQEFFGGGSQHSDLFYNVVGLAWFLGRNQLTQSKLGDFTFVDRAFVFNGAGEGSVFRSQYLTRANKDAASSLFAHRYDSPPALWSGDDIAFYLLSQMAPILPIKRWTIKIGVPGDPSTDETRYIRNIFPTIRQENRTILSILNELCSPHRALCWWFEFAEETTAGDHFGTIRINSFAPEDWDLGESPQPSFGTLYGNHTKKDLHTIGSQADVVYTRVGDNFSREYDQVVMRGARRQSIGSFNIASDNTLEPDWDSSAQDDYDTALGSDIDANKSYRDSSTLSTVYSQFRIPKPLADTACSFLRCHCSLIETWLARQLAGRMALAYLLLLFGEACPFRQDIVTPHLPSLAVLCMWIPRMYPPKKRAIWTTLRYCRSF